MVELCLCIKSTEAHSQVRQWGVGHDPPLPEEAWLEANLKREGVLRRVLEGEELLTPDVAS